MKATLLVKDVGGLRGAHDYQFESGRLNFIESANAAGKTSVVRALASVLSVPRKGYTDNNYVREAQKLGIKTDPTNPREGFVNIHADEASVELDIGDRRDTYSVRKNGSPTTMPELGDQRFLLAGILSNDSRILRQLHGLEEYEADDFKWAVNQLSSAERYERIAQVLKNKEEDLEEKLFAVRKAVQQRAALLKQETDYRKKLEAFDAELARLRSRVGGLEPLLTRRGEIGKKVNKLIVEIGETSGTLEGIRKRLELPRRQLKEMEDRKARLERDLGNIRVEEIERDRRLKEPEIQSRLEKLTGERSEVDGLLNLFVTAEATFRQHKQAAHVACPLCEDGELTYARISSKLSELRRKRDGLNMEIIALNEKRSELENQLSKAKEEAQDLRAEISDLGTQIKTKRKELEEPEISIRSFETTIANYGETRAALEKELAELTKQISKSDEQVSREYSSKEKSRTDASIELGGILTQLGQLSSFEIFGVVAEPSKAETAGARLLQMLKDAISYSETKAEEERQEAAKRFNDSIQSLMQKVGFTEFRNIRLNKDYRLYVERLNPKSKDYVSQQVKTLSTSEKLVIALILQIALKETYIPSIPFFVIDNVIEDFDNEKKPKVMAYLTQKAKDEDWFVVTTKLVEDVAAPRIRAM